MCGPHHQLSHHAKKETHGKSENERGFFTDTKSTKVGACLVKGGRMLVKGLNPSRNRCRTIAWYQRSLESTQSWLQTVQRKGHPLYPSYLFLFPCLFRPCPCLFLFRPCPYPCHPFLLHVAFHTDL